MNQRTDARAAKFVRPKFWQMIQRQLDAHNGLLLQQANCSEPVVGRLRQAPTRRRLTEMPLHPFPTTYAEKYEE